MSCKCIFVLQLYYNVGSSDRSCTCSTQGPDPECQLCASVQLKPRARYGDFFLIISGPQTNLSNLKEKNVILMPILG